MIDNLTNIIHMICESQKDKLQNYKPILPYSKLSSICCYCHHKKDKNIVDKKVPCKCYIRKCLQCKNIITPSIDDSIFCFEHILHQIQDYVDREFDVIMLVICTYINEYHHYIHEFHIRDILKLLSIDFPIELII